VDTPFFSQDVSAHIYNLYFQHLAHNAGGFIHGKL